MQVSYPRTLAQRAGLYANAIYEVRMRLRMIEQLQRTQAPELFLFESCQLQLRMCCELLAVACLAAQGNFEAHKAFRERFEPPVIFKAIEQIYPAFFPHPATVSRTDPGNWHIDLAPDRPGAISREYVERIWSLSGAHLHRTSSRRYIQRSNKVDFKSVTEATEAFWWLIVSHAITLAPAISGVTATILSVLADRENDLMRLQFLHVNNVERTIRVEDFKIQSKEMGGS